MKKFMLRGREKFAIQDEKYMPKSLEYGVWYDLVTPFDWQYFKLKKGSRYVCVYDFVGDKKPAYIVTRKRFLFLLTWCKGTPKPVFDDNYNFKNLVRRNS